MVLCVMQVQYFFPILCGFVVCLWLIAQLIPLGRRYNYEHLTCALATVTTHLTNIYQLGLCPALLAMPPSLTFPYLAPI